MRKAGLFLRLGIVTILTTFSYSVTSAQTNTDSAPKKGTVSSTVVESNPQPVSGQTNIEKSFVTTDATQTEIKNDNKAIDSSTPVSSGNRNCTPRANNHPYSITRADFNKLPKDRQQFILDNLNKYSIID